MKRLLVLIGIGSSLLLGACNSHTSNSSVSTVQRCARYGAAIVNHFDGPNIYQGGELYNGSGYAPYSCIKYYGARSHAAALYKLEQTIANEPAPSS